MTLREVFEFIGIVRRSFRWPQHAQHTRAHHLQLSKEVHGGASFRLKLGGMTHLVLNRLEKL